jgi:hypothetical protein
LALQAFYVGEHGTNSLGMQVLAIAVARDPPTSSPPRNRPRELRQRIATYQLFLRRGMLLLGLGEVLLVLVVVRLLGLDDLLLALGGVSSGRCSDVSHGESIRVWS